MQAGVDERLPARLAKPRIIAVSKYFQRTSSLSSGDGQLDTDSVKGPLMAIADLLLQSIKRYASSLKKEFNIKQAQGLEFTATIHGFTSWHDLTTVAERDPFDIRLRAAALACRSSPAVRIPSCISQAIAAAGRLQQVTHQPAEVCARANMSARGFNTLEEMMVPVFHLGEFTCHKHKADWTFAHRENEKFSLNLFDPVPRLTTIWATPGFGKSTLGMAIGIAQANYGGDVCYLDPTVNDSPRLSPGLDHALMLRNIQLSEPDGSIQQLSLNEPLGPLTRITGIGCPLERSAPFPDCSLLTALKRVRKELKPFSVLVVDESDRWIFGGHGADIAAEIDQILADGVAVVVLTQLGRETWDDALFSPATRANQVRLIGSVMASIGTTDEEKEIVRRSKNLAYIHGQSAEWLASVRTHGQLDNFTMLVMLQNVLTKTGLDRQLLAERKRIGGMMEVQRGQSWDFL
jgi:hypothetical protein